MINLSKKNIVKVANDTGFIKDNVEKVMRLIDILETIFESEWKDKLVLKGGTAINLFYANMPRLSVDIDLDYTGKTRDEMQKDKELFSIYIKGVLSQKGYACLDASKNYFALDSFVFQYINNGGNKDNIKIEVNYLDRAHILPINKKCISTLNYDGEIKIAVLNEYELYGSKFAALIGRSKPRDIYDVANVIDSHLLDDKALLKKCFIFYNCIGGDKNILDKNFDIIDEVKNRDFMTMLKPVLSKKEKFDHDNAKSKIKSYLNELLEFSDKEILFVEKFKQNKYEPELLFNEVDYRDNVARIGWHPMAYWRCKSDDTLNDERKMEEAIKIYQLMENKGIHTITRMSDIEVIEKAGNLSDGRGEEFYNLYYGKDILNDSYKNISRLIMYICAFSDDKEQVFRIFKSSGQFNDNINLERCNSIIDDTLKTFLEYKTKETFTEKTITKAKNNTSKDK